MLNREYASEFSDHISPRHFGAILERDPSFMDAFKERALQFADDPYYALRSLAHAFGDVQTVLGRLWWIAIFQYILIGLASFFFVCVTLKWCCRRCEKRKEERRFVKTVLANQGSGRTSARYDIERGDVQFLERDARVHQAPAVPARPQHHHPLPLAGTRRGRVARDLAAMTQMGHGGSARV